MSKVVNTRIPKEFVEEIEKIAEEEHLDRASLLRKWVLEKIEEYRIQKSAIHYAQGTISIAEAATLAKASLYKMLEYVQKNNITPPQESLDEIRAEHSAVKKLLEKYKSD